MRCNGIQRGEAWIEQDEDLFRAGFEQRHGIGMSFVGIGGSAFRSGKEAAGGGQGAEELATGLVVQVS
jgi:hypothetical protein